MAEQRQTRAVYLLRRYLPQLESYAELAKTYHRQLLPYYEQYTREVSPEDTAISLELACFLFWLCQQMQPGWIADLGSGFSSVVFRLYVADAVTEVRVYSVDNSPLWLDRTRSFLIEHDLSVKYLELWDSFIAGSPRQFDLILHDLGTTKVRGETLGQVLGLVHAEGLVILDDMHKPEYEPLAKQIVRDSHFALYSLRDYTLDEFGRYASIAIPEGLRL